MKSTRLLLLPLILLLNSCAHLEPFADRATAFNEETANTQDRTLMLNVLRAAYRYPMHFTELSTLSGTQTVSGTAGLSIPFSHLYGATDTRLGTLSTAVSQSPTFNMAVLETQEFYRGMLAQLSTDQLYTYLSDGMPRDLIFMLAFSGFRFQQSTKEGVINISNNFHKIADESAENTFCGGRAYESECFMDILHVLKGRGLTVEPSKDAKNIGAPLSAK